MTWTDRIIWQKGVLLSTQYFQQQDRHRDQPIQRALRAAQPHGWGMAEMVIDQALLAKGRFALAQASGFFEDGTAFALPGEADDPPPLHLGDHARGAIIYLARPVGGLADRTEAANDPGHALYGASSPPPDLPTGRARLSYLLESDERIGYLCIALARVKHVSADWRVTLDDRFIAPSLLSSASSSLSAVLAELVILLNERGETLAARLGATTARRVSHRADFLLLQSLNRWLRLIAHWADAPHLHPVDLYTALLQMAGELATFSEATRRPRPYPAYRHADLQSSFAPVIADLRRSLAMVLERTEISVADQKRSRTARVRALIGRAGLPDANFVLSVQADMPADELRQLFPAQAKIGAIELIHDLADKAEPGIAIRPLPVVPRQIPFQSGASYFELDRSSPHWQQMPGSGGFAIQVSGEFPNLRMELWAIQG
jgi:type VI secretion system protein ImpJ